jgi:adenylate kinase family enzyme
MHFAILGNAGSGKSTLAKRLAQARGIPVLDLDTVAWQPNKIAVARDPAEAAADVQVFCTDNANWVVEGCYASLVEVALALQPRLLFLDPGPDACLAHCMNRPWEPHKFASKAEQDTHLSYLLAWVADYYQREDDTSLYAHRALYEAYDGSKVRLTDPSVYQDIQP